MMVKIRPARAEDIFEIEACLVEARREIDIAIPAHETPFVYHVLLTQADNGLLFVAESDEFIVGVIALAIHHWPWNRKIQFMVNEHFYVHPDYRDGGTAKRLLDAAKRAADLAGLALRIDLMGGGDRVMKDKFMEQSGFQYLGGQFLYSGE